jgi:5-methyltetrahydrofolate--homocysteine methyltransferase
VLDGAMGTMIQRLKLDEAGYRGERFKDWPRRARQQRPAHPHPARRDPRHSSQVFRPAPTSVETNTFSSTSIAQADYGMESLVYELNVEGARLAREARDPREKEDGRAASSPARSGRPTARPRSRRTSTIRASATSPSTISSPMREQMRGLIDGGSDIILIETIFDTLNAKAAIFACERIFDERGFELPIMISGTITDLRAARCPARRRRPSGIRCATPAVHHRAQLRARRRRHAPAYRGTVRSVADTFICAYPNAGLPNEFGLYDESPDSWPAVEEFAREGLVNIVGGCCGTTPDHIRAIAARRQHAARHPRAPPLLRLSGLEPFTLTPEIPFVNVGERTNVTGSAKFRKLITAGDYAAALAVAREQVENGAQIIDVNMDEGLLDSEKAMVEFLNLIAAEPDIARVPVMIDSSKWEVIEAGLKCVQGKAIVNSISMKEGEEPSSQHARLVRAMARPSS